MIKISTFCSGIGAAEQAIKELGVNHEVVFCSEIDKYARLSYLANHTTSNMINDMTKCDYVGDEYYSDLNISGLPCQTFSLAGLRKGESDSRGLLFYDFYRYVKNQQPKVFIIENVKGLLSSKSCITYENILYLLLHNFNEIKEWEQLNFQKNSLSTLGQTISLYLLQNFAKKLNLKMDKSATSFNTRSELSYERLETKVKSGLKRRLKFLEERICQITKKSTFYPQELTVPLGCKEADLVLNQKQSYLIENIIPKATSILEKTVNINANTSLFANKILEDNSKKGKLYTTLTELNSTTDLKTFMYVLELNIIRLIVLALDLSPNLWKEIWLILTKKMEFIGLKTFDIWTSRLSNLNYNLHWQVLNSKNFGVPQNRERVFIVGIRKDLPNDFRFPIGWRLDKRLRDVLETEVDEKYYLSEKMIQGFLNKPTAESYPFKPLDVDKQISSCLTARYFKMGATDPYIQVKVGYINQDTQASQVFGINRISPTLSAGTHGYAQGYISEPKIHQKSRGFNKGGLHDICPPITSNSFEQNNVLAEPQLKQIAQIDGFESEGRIYDSNGLARTIKNGGGGGSKTGWYEVDEKVKVIANLPGKNESNNRIYSIDGISPTILAGNNGGGQSPVKHLTKDARIRRLTPLEVFRLQAFPDDFFYKCKAVNSDSQLYKQAGNSITVNVMREIINNLIHILG